MNATKNRFRFLVLLLVMCFSLAPISPAQAATNGQQIAVYACQANRVVLRGSNQWGQSVSYTLNKSSSSCDWHYISGWWWKGNVMVYAYYPLSPTPAYQYYLGRIQSVYVPTFQSSNWVFTNVPAPSPRDWIMWRAQTWVTDRVTYSQVAPYRDGYRRDCSGYVSFAWTTSTPGFTTSSWSTNASRISFDSLQPGDALNSQNGGHILLFKRWVNQSAGTFDAYEQNPFYGGAHITTNITLNKSTGVLTLPGYTYPGNYFAIRKNGL